MGPLNRPWNVPLAGVGASLSLLASWALVRFLFELPFDPPRADLGALTAATVIVTAGLAGLGGWRARQRSPLAALRAG